MCVAHCNLVHGQAEQYVCTGCKLSHSQTCNLLAYKLTNSQTHKLTNLQATNLYTVTRSSARATLLAAEMHAAATVVVAWC